LGNSLLIKKQIFLESTGANRGRKKKESSGGRRIEIMRKKTEGGITTLRKVLGVIRFNASPEKQVSNFR
jgi:hypothetical protein